jgi:hypothetical protein
MFLAGSSFTPRGSFSGPSGLGQYEFHFDQESLPLTDEETQARGIDEILAAMEEGAARAESKQSELVSVEERGRKSESTYLPTPETDGSDTPALTTASSSKRTQSRQASEVSNNPPSTNPLGFSPESMASPYATASSTATSIVSRIIPSVRAPHPTQVQMPTQAFVPPPPMCMFFNPSFKDLQKGKVGVWKGDLKIRGRGGGVFSVLIVGEEGSGDLW